MNTTSAIGGRRINLSRVPIGRSGDVFIARVGRINGGNIAYTARLEYIF